MEHDPSLTWQAAVALALLWLLVTLYATGIVDSFLRGGPDPAPPRRRTYRR